MVLFDLLSRAGAMRIIWELRSGGRDYEALRVATALNRRLLNTRLKELSETGVVHVRGDKHELTSVGRSLLKQLIPLVTWSKKWVIRVWRTLPDGAGKQ